MYNARIRMKITPKPTPKMVMTTIRQEDGQSLTRGPEPLNLILPYTFPSIVHSIVFLGNAIL